MSRTRPAPLLDDTPRARAEPFAWTKRRPVLTGLALIGGIVLLAIWTGQDHQADHEACLEREGTPVVVNAALNQIECRLGSGR
ncbi:hypothetical protein [Mitsuaria sp. GD03876]|uniref:hypothetical protein n=1 Tax=Mitsuaria sp. GD03876 TaxID=2975399 RepID=UPI00244A28E1|nr:hypothetical protein [Mitsuaria sp. GD03876]MDH0866483.1 hypothetical protein [Mitsuaria sp. GD03876]